MNRTWFKITALADGEARVDIYDEIGAWGIRAVDFIKALKDLGPVARLSVHINSPGGEVFDGLAIYNNLKAHSAEVVVVVDGLAASAASVIAMAGDRVIMPANAMMMIHDPSGLVMGDADDMREMAGILEKISVSLASTYVSKSGMTPEDALKLMSEDTWLTAQEAVELGLADEVTDEIKIAAKFDLSRYANAPKELQASPLASWLPWFTNRRDDPMTTPNPDPSHAAPVNADPAPAPTPEPAPAPARAAADPVEVSAACTEAGVPALAATLIKARATMDEAKARIATAKEVIDIFDRAKQANPALDASVVDTLVADGISAEAARQVVGNMLANMQSPEINGARTVNGSSDHGWGKSIKATCPPHLRDRLTF